MTVSSDSVTSDHNESPINIPLIPKSTLHTKNPVSLQEPHVNITITQADAEHSNNAEHIPEEHINKDDMITEYTVEPCDTSLVSNAVPPMESDFNSSTQTPPVPPALPSVSTTALVTSSDVKPMPETTSNDVGNVAHVETSDSTNNAIQGNLHNSSDIVNMHGSVTVEKNELIPHICNAQLSTNKHATDNLQSKVNSDNMNHITSSDSDSDAQNSSEVVNVHQVNGIETAIVNTQESSGSPSEHPSTVNAGKGIHAESKALNSLKPSHKESVEIAPQQNDEAVSSFSSASPYVNSDENSEPKTESPNLSKQKKRKQKRSKIVTPFQPLVPKTPSKVDKPPRRKGGKKNEKPKMEPILKKQTGRPNLRSSVKPCNKGQKRTRGSLLSMEEPKKKQKRSTNSAVKSKDVDTKSQNSRKRPMEKGCNYGKRIKCEPMQPTEVVTYKTPAEIKQEKQLMPQLNRKQQKSKLLQETYIKKEVSASSDGRFHCEICSRHYKERKTLNAHVKVHFASGKYNCSTCQRNFHNKSEWEWHEANHTDKRYFVCGKCTKGFKSAQNLKDHVRGCQIGEEKSKVVSIKCSHCNKPFSSQSSLRCHLHNVLQGPYICKVCGKIYPQYSSF